MTHYVSCNLYWRKSPNQDDSKKFQLRDEKISHSDVKKYYLEEKKVFQYDYISYYRNLDCYDIPEYISIPQRYKIPPKYSRSSAIIF